MLALQERKRKNVLLFLLSSALRKKGNHSFQRFCASGSETAAFQVQTVYFCQFPLKLPFVSMDFCVCMVTKMWACVSLHVCVHWPCYCWSGKDWTGRNKSYIDSPTDFLDGNTIWFSMSDLCNCRWFCGLLKAVIIHAYLHRGVANYEGTTNASNFLSWSISGYIGQNYEDDFYCSELWKPLVEAEGKERI